MIRTLKQYSLAGLSLIWLMSSCQSADGPCDATAVTISAPQSETTALKQYIDSNHIKATADKRGFYYTIQSPGSGAKPTVCDNVTVNYKGQLTNGSTFDSGDDVSFGLNQLIVGWQEGIPLVAPGGSLTLYLPPSLAYGSQEQSGIPANSILIFKIDLIKIN
ncbi:FKBP-type peptidyl-prolyl cis-trans isomerase [Spirosoma oryzicola]|uniref:FKBP-type peptidyl-prolyl cis-trans isomerase n=1 Tax=Spirosoma oryzicola TaxID=2898794 RepID=UPI001E3C3F83|nr:FKBP-type peptidyl-prolyl cis-trans isomerase [Spirosoma oryzicola]UHG90749.1 FKBP-type peptidyl-prolyl cis-trans isomerase [Spirosoma oryzicola]